MMPFPGLCPWASCPVHLLASVGSIPVLPQPCGCLPAGSIHLLPKCVLCIVSNHSHIQWPAILPRDCGPKASSEAPLKSRGHLGTLSGHRDESNYREP